MWQPPTAGLVQVRHRFPAADSLDNLPEATGAACFLLLLGHVLLAELFQQSREDSM